MKQIFLGALLIMSFAASGAASRGSSSEKMQVVYREQFSGEWEAYIFGPYCPTNMKMHLVEPGNTADPIKIQCMYK